MYSIGTTFEIPDKRRKYTKFRARTRQAPNIAYKRAKRAGWYNSTSGAFIEQRGGLQAQIRAITVVPAGESRAEAPAQAPA